MYNKVVKRLLDICFSILLITLFSPVFLIIAVLVVFFNGFPFLFMQKRPGMHEKIFTIYKFRTMNNKKKLSGELLPDIERTTRLGKFLRNTSLDELPELFNILKGDMSFVGPRPLLVKYLDRYNDLQKRRHLVKPGLTGLAQVNGRNSISWEQKFNFDVFYVDNLTFLLDLKIVIKTFWQVLFQKNINSSDDETATEFI